MLAGNLSLLGGFVFGFSRSHARSHSTVSVSVFCSWFLNRYRFWARLLAATCIRPRPHCCFGLWNVDSGTLKISPRHRYQDIAMFNCRTH